MNEKKQVVIERKLKAAPEKVWALWTTKEGLEKWWAPNGFTSEVKHLDVRTGGHFEIEMTAFVPQIIEFLKRSGMGAKNSSKGDYTEVEAARRLAYTNAVDFVPGLAPYTAATVVTFAPDGAGTRLTVSNDVMHSEEWTGRAKQGWEEQLGKLERLLAETL